MKDLIRKVMFIVILIVMILIFHETIPKPYVYFVDFTGGMIIGYYHGKKKSY